MRKALLLPPLTLVGLLVYMLLGMVVAIPYSVWIKRHIT